MPIGELNPPDRLLLGPGPANISPRVYRALSSNILGHLDPAFIAIMDETVQLLREVFGTKNGLTIPVSGTGSAGMEAAICNVVEPGDTIVVGINGYFGERITEMATRYGAKVIRVEAEWGSVLPPEKLEAALKQAGKPKALAVVHGETSTGALQPIKDLPKLAQRYGALLLVDTVTTLGGAEVCIDDWGVDICYSGTQKCIGAPPGLAPLTFGPRAVEALKSRKTKVANWYLDLSLLGNYWGGDRVYHHTAPISMIYSLREALRLVVEEGLENRWARHRKAAKAFRAGLDAIGVKCHVGEPNYIPSLTTVCVPPGVDDAATRKALLIEHNIEVGGGLGPLKGKVWRVGLMGYNAKSGAVFSLLEALDRVLPKQGFKVPAGTSLAAAERVFAS